MSSSTNLESGPVGLGDVNSGHRRGPRPGLWKPLLRRKAAVGCLAYLVALCAIAVIAPIVLPKVSSQQAGDLDSVLRGPSAAHLLGTDSLGRDVLQRLLVGTRPTLLAVLLATVVAVGLGVPWGIVSGFFGRAADRTLMWIADLMLSIPAIIMILVVVSVFPHSSTAAMITLGVVVAPSMARIARQVTLPVASELYIDAAKISGLTRTKIVTKHVLSRVVGPLTVQASFVAAGALIAQAGLAFLGLVDPAPAPSWGGMVQDGLANNVQQPWLIVPPGILITLTVLALAMLGDSIRDAATEGWAGTVARRGSRTRARVKASENEKVPPRAIAASAGGVQEAPLLTVQGLSVAFRRSGGLVRAVDGVSFSISAGETVGLVGESGSGKTLTAMALLKLLPASAEIEEGRVRFADRDLGKLPPAEFNRVRGGEIGLISQEPMSSLNPAFRVGGQVAEVVRRHSSLSRGEAKARTIELFHRVHLPDPVALARKYPHELSGGMAQRVMIARALAGEPRLLIADEPTTALDVTMQADILDLLGELQRSTGMAVLLVSHDWGVIADRCDRAIVMYAGQVVEECDVSLTAIFARPMHPYTAALLASNPYYASPADELPVIPGSVPQLGEWPAGCRFAPRCSFAEMVCSNAVPRLEEVEPGRQVRCARVREILPLRPDIMTSSVK